MNLINDINEFKRPLDKLLGADNFYTRAPRISDWQEVKKKILELERKFDKSQLSKNLLKRFIRTEKYAGLKNQNKQSLESIFTNYKEEIENSSENAQWAFAITLAIYYKSFLSLYKSPLNFSKQPKKAKMDFLKRYWKTKEKLLIEGDYEKAVPMEIFAIYIAAMIENDRTFEKEIATFLDKRVQEGWSLAIL